MGAAASWSQWLALGGRWLGRALGGVEAKGSEVSEGRNGIIDWPHRGARAHAEIRSLSTFLRSGRAIAASEAGTGRSHQGAE